MNARDAILNRLRAAGGPVAALPESYDLAWAAQDSVQLFIDRVTAVGVEVVVSSAQALPSQIVRAARSISASAVAIWDDPLLAPVGSALKAAGVEIIPPVQQTKARLADAGIGITTADYAIALTGTLVLTCSPQRPRSTSLLPPLHLAVLPRNRIVPTLGHLISRLSRLPSDLTLITGPSRTADIELTPVRGVHGPTAVRIYLLL